MVLRPSLSVFGGLKNSSHFFFYLYQELEYIFVQGTICCCVFFCLQAPDSMYTPGLQAREQTGTVVLFDLADFLIAGTYRREGGGD